MRYRVYSGPKGSGEISPLAKEQMLFKEFTALDERCHGRAMSSRAAASRC